MEQTGTDRYEVRKSTSLGAGNYDVFYDGVKVGEIYRIPDYDVLHGLRWSAIDHDGETIHQFTTLKEAKASLAWLFNELDIAKANAKAHNEVPVPEDVPTSEGAKTGAFILNELSKEEATFEIVDGDQPAAKPIGNDYEVSAAKIRDWSRGVAVSAEIQVRKGNAAIQRRETKGGMEMKARNAKTGKETTYSLEHRTPAGGSANAIGGAITDRVSEAVALTHDGGTMAVWRVEEDGTTRLFYIGYELVKQVAPILDVYLTRPDLYPEVCNSSRVAQRLSELEAREDYLTAKEAESFTKAEALEAALAKALNDARRSEAACRVTEDLLTKARNKMKDKANEELTKRLEAYRR